MIGSCSWFAVLVACCAVGGCRSAGQQSAAAGYAPRDPLAAGSLPQTAPFRFFSPRSFWNQPVSDHAALDPSSAEVVGSLANEMATEEHAERGPWINIGAYGVPIYTVSAQQPTVRVRLAAIPQGGVSAIARSESVHALQKGWRAVPLPPDARPASGTDGHLVVWQPRTDRLWEFWQLVRRPFGWSGSWGGAMRHVSRSDGVYSSKAWPGAGSAWGASASSLSIAGGLITLEDVKAGRIDHALAIAVPNVRGGVYALPARRTDGSSNDPLSLPEGAHLRLDPALNLTALHLPPLTRMLAEAAQRYGLYIRDGGPIGAFFGQRPAPTEANPYNGPNGYFEGKYPNQILAPFPWSH